MTRRFRIPLLAPVLALGLLAGPLAPGLGVAAAAGELDPNFGVGGVVDLAPFGLLDAQGVAVQPDGKIVVGGRTTPEGGDFGLVRLLPDGTPDPDFGQDGRVASDFGGEEDVADLLLLDDGAILVAGTSLVPDGDGGTVDYFVVARYDQNGALDPGFGEGGVAAIQGLWARARDLAVALDGSIVVGGQGRSFQSQGCGTALQDASGNDVPFADLISGEADAVGPRSGVIDLMAYVARFDRTGRPDFAFGGEDGLLGRVCRGPGSAVGVRDDGSIVLGFSLPPGLNTVLGSILVFGTNGDLVDDDVFLASEGFGSYGSLTALAVRPPDGAIVTAGSICDERGTGCDFAVARFLANGEVDLGFNQGGANRVDFGEPNASVSAVALTTEGGVVAAGVVAAGALGRQFAVARFAEDGRLDPAFGQDGSVIGGVDGTATDVALQPDGGIVVGGHRGDGAAPTGGVVARYLGGGVGTQPQPLTDPTPTPTPEPGPLPPDPVTPTPPPGPQPVPPDVLAGTYTSPTVGYRLEWDPDQWQALEVSTTEGADKLRLSNGVSTLELHGIAFDGTVEECRDEAVAASLAVPEFAGFAPTQERRSTGTITPALSWATLTDGERVLYVECRSPLVPGQPADYENALQGTYVLVYLDTPSEGYAEESTARDQLLNQLGLG